MVVFFQLDALKSRLHVQQLLLQFLRFKSNRNITMAFKKKDLHSKHVNNILFAQI